MYCVFSDGRRALSSNSLVRVRLFEAWPSQTLLGKYFTINDQMELDTMSIPLCQGKKAKEDKMSTATCIPRRSPIQVLTGLNLA